MGLNCVQAGTVTWSWQPCDGQTSLSGFSTSPAKPHLGHNFNVLATIALTTEVSQGATLEYSGSVDAPPAAQVSAADLLSLSPEVREEALRLMEGGSKGRSFSGSVDLCDTAVNVSLPLGAGHVKTDGFKCPQSKGAEFSITANAEISDAVRWLFPNGSVSLKAKNEKGEEFACAKASYKISGWEMSLSEDLFYV